VHNGILLVCIHPSSDQSIYLILYCCSLHDWDQHQMSHICGWQCIILDWLWMTVYHTGLTVDDSVSYWTDTCLSFNFFVRLKHFCQFCDETTGVGLWVPLWMPHVSEIFLSADSYYPAQRARVRSRGQRGPKMWLQDWRWDRPRLQEEAAGIHRQCMSSTLALVTSSYIIYVHFS
jgi:hypothetical protein